MEIKAQINIGDTITINNRNNFRFGRTYRVIRFAADKFGARFAVCEWLQEQGCKSQHLLYSGDFA